MFETLVSWENLVLAYRAASRGKRRHRNVATFEHRLEDELAALRRELIERSYRPGSYTSFYIHEPKRRLISAAPFRDRVVHHALVQLIEPVLERSFVFDSYANRVGKGTHRALDRCQHLARQHRYVLQLDLRQFFPSIDHRILRSLLAVKVQDDGVLWLIDQILASGAGVLDNDYDMVYFPGDDLFAVNRPRGLPIGNLTSQFWANVLLNPIDHFILRELRCSGYVRYVDDLLLFGESKDVLWEAKACVEQRLARLRLTNHPGAHPRPVREGIPFLGFLVWPDRRRLKQRNGIRFRRRLRGLMRALASGEMTREALAASLQGWENHARYGNTTGLRRAILADVLGATLDVNRGDAMDLKLLADTLAIVLAPALPFLVSGGEEVVRQAGKKLSEEGLELAKKLWEKLRPKVEASPQAKGAAADLAEEPDEEDARIALRRQLRKILEADPSLAAELDALLQAASSRPGSQAVVYGSGAIAQGPGAVAAGAGGTAVSGGVQGDLIIGGRDRAADE